ncbi:MAG: right-handed parallel beta-helix repeat-containing protein [Candidatus Neomarinimicrobiota bacterium]
MKNKIVIISYLIFSTAYSDTIYVPGDYSSIQVAIDSSNELDTILVSPGFYQENINFNGKSIVLTSNYEVENDSLLISSTIIDGGEDGSVVVFNNNEGNNSVIKGFTLQNGNGLFADPDENGTFYTYGGGVYCKGSAPTLKDLIITNNSGDEGGGGGVFCYEASPVIVGCVISENETDDVGGGLYARFSNLSISNTKFISNEADLGAGCYLRNESIPTLNNVEFRTNVAANSGGAIVLKDNADAVFTNVEIINNEAEGLGGGLYINNADPSLDYVLIALNVASAGGGVYMRNNSNPIFNNMTLAYNSSGFDGGGGVYIRDNSELSVSNSVFWENGDFQFYFRDSGDEVELTISYSLVQNNQNGVEDNNNGDLNWGQGMLEGDPYFCNGEAGDFSVRENSLCIDGASDGGLVGYFGAGCGPINTGPVWYVSELGNDSSDGSVETPFTSIQKAIDVSANGDTIRLFVGEYIESFDFLSKQIVLESRAEELDNDTIASQTIISVGPLGGSCIELIGQDAANVEIKNMTFSGGQSQIGGGIYIENSSPKLSGVFVKNNAAEVGGGMYINQSNVELVDITIFNNGANFGGGVYATGSSVNIINSSLDSNLAYWGAGIYSEDSNFDIEMSDLKRNYALIEGGAVYQSGNSFFVSECAIFENSGLDFGGAMVTYNGLLDVQNSTIAGNISNYGAAFNLRESALTIKNSIIWENGENSLYVAAGNQSSMISIDFSDFYGGETYLSENPNLILNWGLGNFDSDPLFCNVSNGDFALQENSSCLVASESSSYIGAIEQTCSQQLSSIDDILPMYYKLYQNYPNPFNPKTTIRYTIAKANIINLSIFSINGTLVKELFNGYKQSGDHALEWDGSDKNNNRVSSGVYLYRLSNGDKVVNMKMVLSK